MPVNILVVDDSKVNLMIAKAAMKDIDAQIDMAMSGDECLEKAKEKKYDVILLDQLMPEKDGLTTFKELRADEGSPNASTPVIMVTASEEVTEDDFLKEGLSGYLAKPFKAADIENALKAHRII
ncbi:MAG: response regulator [Lachnospiraceae bacterium]|nr:response regulator [Lachnospiraceae bacterium]